MEKLSVVIITYNEEKNIRRCLDSVKEIADEIVVIDSFSKDDTEKICRENGAVFIQNVFEGYQKQKTFALTQAHFDCILSLDADEEVSVELKRSILQVKQNWTADAYQMNRLTNYCGKWIHYTGWYPDRKIRLFKRQKAIWQGTNVHESIALTENAILQTLKGNLLHYSFYSISQHLNKLNQYTDIGAQVAFEKGKRVGLLKIILGPFWKFFQAYFLRLGFLDGYYGFVISVIIAFEAFAKYTKIRALNKLTD